MKTKNLWIGFALVTVLSFAVIGYFGGEIYRKAPPIPEKVVTPAGTVLFTAQDIHDGQNVWQSIGGHEIGTIWGHGSYVAPDWSADWLHKEAVFILDKWAAKEFNTTYSALNEEQKVVFKTRMKAQIRINTYDKASGTLTINEDVAEAFASNAAFYEGLFMNDSKLKKLREDYAIKDNAIQDKSRMAKMNAFFFWTAWSCVTNRPDDVVSYTNNWPNEELVGNEAPPSLSIWSGFSVILLLAGIGFLTYLYNRFKHDDSEKEVIPETNPLLGIVFTPSMRAVIKYFWVVVALILVQIGMGVVTAHYGVEGQAFFGLPLSNILPYSISRTWHVQIAIFWIATSWLATGLFIAPAISGHEPKFQKLGVNFLFIALLIIVVGSLIGQWMGVMQKMGLISNFWFGHQGYEYVDLGRFWQIFLFTGLIIWLLLLARAILPAFKKFKESKNLLTLFVISAVAIGLFYGAGLMWGHATNLAIVEYWRWWVVHLWVEGFFEVFATVVIAFLFTRMGLLRIKTATTSVLFSTIVFLLGGIIGTFHHLYFTGTPISILALGSTFSALEVVPLVLMGFEIYPNTNLSKTKNWVQDYKWAIYCFIAVAFWNLVGAGILGFLINPPIALYYMQGLNTTAVHGHAALFGVYGMLGIGLMLFVMRTISEKNSWNDKLIKYAFWSINIGLALMLAISVLPVGILQTIASIKHGMWYARSAEFLHGSGITTLKWMRMFGDTIFSVGALLLFVFIIKLKIIKK